MQYNNFTVSRNYCFFKGGGHVNPAVSLGVLMSGGISVKDFFGYLVSQCLGVLAGSGVLAAVFKLGKLTDMTGGYGRRSWRCRRFCSGRSDR